MWHITIGLVPSAARLTVSARVTAVLSAPRFVPSASLKGLSIVVIEDDKDAREMLEELLDSMPRETILGVLVEKLNAEEIARLTNMRMQ